MKTIFKFILNKIPRPILIRLSIVVRPVLAFLLKGNRFTDPIDGKSFRMFLPYGYGTQRNNVLSPSTLSLERHRLLWLYLKNETDFRQQLLFFNIGPMNLPLGQLFQSSQQSEQSGFAAAAFSHDDGKTAMRDGGGYALDRGYCPFS